MNNYKNYVIAGLVVVLAILVLILLPKQNEDPIPNSGNNNEPISANVDDFESCAQAGYPVMESFPAQCRTPDGQIFVEDVNEGADVVIETPTQGQLVSSPMTVTGKAKGTWFFEANLPITLKDETGKILVQKGAQAQGEWMTEDYVNFTIVLEFLQPTTQYGVLLIERDNPSGLPENDASYAVPVRFK